MDLKLAIKYFKSLELEKIEDHPGLKNEEVVDLVENYNNPVDKHYLENSELVSNEFNRNLNDNSDSVTQRYQT